MTKIKPGLVYPTKTIDGRLHVRSHEGRWLDVRGYQETLRTWPHSYVRDMDDKGIPFLGFATHVDPPCGCRIVGCGTLQFPLTIEFCKKHREEK